MRPRRARAGGQDQPAFPWGRSSAGRAPALHAGGQEFEPPRLHQNLRNRLASEPKSKRAARTACLDFGFFAGLNKIHLDEAKRLSLDRLVFVGQRPGGSRRADFRGMLTNLKLKSASARRQVRRVVVVRRGSLRPRVKSGERSPTMLPNARARALRLRCCVSQQSSAAGLNSVASVVWSSEQAHSVDALAAEGDEGR